MTKPVPLCLTIVLLWVSACGTTTKSNKAGTSATEGSVSLISWNVESGGAEASAVVEGIRAIVADKGKLDVWAFSEVEDEGWASSFQSALGNEYTYVLGTSGRSDKLCIMYDQTRFKQLAVEEYEEMNPGGRVRAPLLVHLKANSSGKELMVMVNHLYRSRAERRQEQAAKLNEWIQGINIPVVLAGDYNFDYDLDDRVGNKSFNIFMEGGHFDWIEPKNMIKTQCSPRYNSILDFVFVNDDAFDWDAQSEVIVRDGDCEKSDRLPDHRPIFATFTF